jgi:hypothetical protein
VLQPAARVHREEVAAHRRMVRALLDQLDLHLAGIRQCDRQVDVVIALAAIAERRQRQALGIEPWTDAAHLDPMPHRSLDVGDDIAHLAQRSEQPAHGVSSILCGAILRLMRLPFKGATSDLVHVRKLRSNYAVREIRAKVWLKGLPG